VAFLHRFVTVQMCSRRFIRLSLLNVMTSHHMFVLQVFEERAKEHDKHGGDPEYPHKLHIVTRVKSTMRRPYWEKKVVKSLGLMKVGCDHPFNTPSVNNLLKIIKHLVRIEPLKVPYGLPAEEDMANTYLNSRGELVVKHLLKPLEQKAIES
uniref:Large ribosomal subunit protein uL30m n=1 Tax=Sinocyclocheilus anshuiensis TaxID=1608454 RepID=A0A671PH32_9TELE